MNSLTNLLFILVLFYSISIDSFCQGQLFSWGDNRHGQASFILEEITNVKEVLAGGSYSAVLKENGEWVTWGQETGNITYAETGPARAIYGNTPGFLLITAADSTLYPFFNPASAMNRLTVKYKGIISGAVGYYHALAVTKEGTVVGWGDTTYGKLNIPADLKDVVSVACGDDHSLALLSNGTVRAWGRNYFGECNVPPGLKNVKAITAGFGHSLALLGDGTLVPWGHTGNAVVKDTNYVKSLSGIAQISSHGSYHLVVKTDGSLIAWSIDGYPKDIGIPANLGPVSKASINMSHIIVLKKDGQVQSWMLPSYVKTNDMTDVPQSIAGAQKLSPSADWTLALQEDSTLYAWGNNEGSQLNLPLNVRGVVDIAAAGTHGVALLKNGTVVDWGTYPGASFNLIRKPETLSQVSSIATSRTHSLALKTDGTVVAWGTTESFGALDVPPGLKGVTSIAAGTATSYALTEEGKIVAWGYQYIGQADILDSLKNVKQVSAGDNHTLALLKDGRVIGWGKIFADGANPPSALADVENVSANFLTSYALDKFGKITGWGSPAFVPTFLDNKRVLEFFGGSLSGHQFVRYVDDTLTALDHYHKGNEVNFALFPNPCNDHFFLSGPVSSGAPVYVILSNGLGQVVQESIINEVGEPVNIHLPAGLYAATLSQGSKRKVVKVMVK